MLDYITLYIPMVVLPQIKATRSKQYYRFLNNFATTHVAGCKANIKLWEPVLQRTERDALEAAANAFKS